ncbi:MAG: hypothetical protein HY556_11530 [Euryarchaeota archaeon]|nr:hypothetical protein [Euryarchaeota archaeon]
MGKRISELGDVRLLIHTGYGFEFMRFLARLLREIPKHRAAIWVADEPTVHVEQVLRGGRKKRFNAAFKFVLARCDPRFVSCERMRRSYEQRYGLPFDVMYNPIHDEALRRHESREFPPPGPMDRPTVFISGNNGHLGESFGTLARAFDLVERQVGRRPLLVASGNVAKGEFLRFGFEERDIRFLGRLRTKADVIRAGQQASCAFIASTFAETTRQNNCGCPSRASDYLVAGVPILAHGGPDTGIVDYMEANDLDYVCQSLAPKDLAATLSEVVSLGPDDRAALRRKYHGVARRQLASVQRAKFLGIDKAGVNAR